MESLKLASMGICTLLALGIMPSTFAKPATADAAEVAAPPAPDASAEQLLDLALDAIAAQQKSVKDLTVSGALKEENRDPKTGKWDAGAEREAAATYDGADVRRCQIACRLSKTPTPDAADPFQVERYILIYDGKVALKLIEPDNGLSIAMCEITAGKPPEVDDTARATGLPYSALGWKEPSADPKKAAQPLLALLREARSLPGFHAEKVTDKGRDFLDVIAPRPDVDGPAGGSKIKHELHFRLDIAKGYALARVESYVTDAGNWRHKAWQMEATDFTEPLRGLFYPGTIVLSSMGATKQTESVVETRTTVDVSKVQMNSAPLEDTFNIEKIELPVGTSNLRDANGGVIRFTPGQEQALFARVAKQVLAKAEKMKPATQPARTP